MPFREIWSESASVWVELPLAPTEYGMSAFSAAALQQFVDLGGKGGAAADHGTGSERVAADLFLVHPGGIGRVGHVDCDREVGTDGEGGGPGTEQADLLLDGGDRGEPGPGLLVLVDAAKGLEGDVGTEAVVHRARDETATGHFHRRGFDHDRVADRDHLLGLFLVLGADVDVHLLELHDLLALLGVEQVDRQAAGHSGHLAVVAGDRDPLADEDLGIPAADRGEVEEALVVDVGDDQADLVDVPDDRDQRGVFVFADRGDAATEAVGGDLRRSRRPRARPWRRRVRSRRGRGC